jgi:hypothetical protein
MTTQFERDQMRRGKEARRMLALLEAGAAQPDPSPALIEALAAYRIEDYRSSVSWADREDAHRAAAEAKVAEGERRFAELPDAPPRMQCGAAVARDQGRWTEFGRCEKVANRIVMDYDNHRERVLCSGHAREFVTTGKAPGIGWADAAHNGKYGGVTHESWYRIKGWCMEPDPRPDPRKPTRYCTVKVDKGRGTHPEKEHKFQ